MSTQVSGTETFGNDLSAKIVFSDEAMQIVQKIIARYPEGKHKSALLPILHIAQSEFDGWLSPETMDYVASILNIKPIEVYEVASFYSMYNLKPVGKCVLEVCRTSSCWVRGAEDVVKHLEKKLGIKEGETTKDGMFTIKTVECLGSCGTAPMLQCGASYHENLTLEKVDQLLEDYRANGKQRSYTDMDYKNTL
jgi:NADH-quinone oxidoreductase subunit E